MIVRNNKGVIGGILTLLILFIYFSLLIEAIIKIAQ